MSIFEALTAGLNDTDRDVTLDVIAQRFTDDQASARRGHTHRDVEERPRRRRARPPRPVVVASREDGLR